jgi:hypothetical protein
VSYCAPLGIPHSQFLEWSPDDREKALWWEIHRRQTCSSCGTRPEEFEGDKDAYAPQAWHCRGCEIKARGDEEFEKHRKEYRRGTTMRLTKAGG